jgi:hypothetical protein
MGMKKWLPPYKLLLGKGTRTVKPGDVIFGPYVDLVVSQKFKITWESSSLKGIVKWTDVEIMGPRPVEENFYLVELTPARAKPDLSKMIVAWGKGGPPNCQVCFGANKDAIKGYYILEDSIPDADLFHVLGNPDILTTERFRKMVITAGLKNIDLISAEDFKWDPLHKSD